MIDDFEGWHLTSFAGLPVFDVPAGGIEDPERWPGAEFPEDVEAWAWRISVDSWRGTPFLTWFELFLRDVDTTRVRALVFGNWIQQPTMQKPSGTFFGPLIAAADRFPALRAVFLGDIDANEYEISWIRQDDVTPLLEAFPQLRVLGVRGGTEGLELQPFAHQNLRWLTFQAGGLPPAVIRAVGASELPALTDLELYLGEEAYGGGSVPEDLTEILAGSRLPSLRYLGIRNAENADDFAVAVAHAPIVAQLEVLDLSLGDLGDAGAAALLAGQPLTHLKKLDLHHHYLSEAMQARLVEALPGVEVDLTDPQEDDEGERYIAVSE